MLLNTEFGRWHRTEWRPSWCMIMGSDAEDLEERVEKMLNGEGLEVTELASMTDRMQAVKLRKTVCYIVSAVIFNEKVSVFVLDFRQGPE